MAISKFIILSLACSVYYYPGHAIYTSCILLFRATETFILQLIHLISVLPPCIPIGKRLFVIILSPVSVVIAWKHQPIIINLSLQSPSNAVNWKDFPRNTPCFYSFTVNAVFNSSYAFFSNLWVIAVYLVNNSRVTAKMYIITWFLSAQSLTLVTKLYLKIIIW